MRDETAAGNLIGAAEAYASDDRVPKAARSEFFRTLFDTDRKAVPELYRLLAEVPARHWLTTNFDNNAKHILEARDHEIVSHPQFSPVISLWNEKRFCVYVFLATGSSATVLRRGGQDAGLGRWREMTLFPWSFREHVQLRNLPTWSFSYFDRSSEILRRAVLKTDDGLLDERRTMPLGSRTGLTFDFKAQPPAGALRVEVNPDGVKGDLLPAPDRL